MDARKPLLVASGVCWGACSIAHSLQLKGVKSDNVSSTVFRYAALGALQLVVLWALIQLSHLWSAALWIIALRNNESSGGTALEIHEDASLRIHDANCVLVDSIPSLVHHTILCRQPLHPKISFISGIRLHTNSRPCPDYGSRVCPRPFWFTCSFLVVCTCFVGLLNDPNEWIDLPVCRVITALLSTIIMFLCGIYVYFSSRRNSPTATTTDH